MAKYTESFNQANNTILGPDLTWAEIAGNLGTTSNRAQSVNANSEDTARAQHDTDTADMYAQATLGLWARPSSIDVQAGVAVRFSPSALTAYVAHFHLGATAAGDRWTLYRRVAGAYTMLADLLGASATTAPGNVIRIEAEGPTIRLLVNGVVKLSAVDAIQTGTRGGILTVRRATGACALDDFEVGDLPVLYRRACLSGLGTGGRRILDPLQ